MAFDNLSPLYPLYKVPITDFDDFKQTSIMWIFHVKLESNVIPKCLGESTCSLNASFLSVSIFLSFNHFRKFQVLFTRSVNVALYLLDYGSQ